MDNEHFVTGSATRQDDSHTHIADVRLTTQSMDWFLLKSELAKPPFKHHRISNKSSEYEPSLKPDLNTIRCAIKDTELKKGAMDLSLPDQKGVKI